MGIFQLESPGMQQLLRKVKPTRLNDISAVLALYRPGPMGMSAHHEYAKRKNSGDNRATIHPELDDLLTEVLYETYGLVVYQEQVMEVISRVTGWGYAESENILTAMRKKKLALLAKSKPSFMEAANRFSLAATTALWETLIPFSDYSFNKSHSVGYAKVAYWTAYLKANHPQQFMTSLLSSTDNIEESAHFIHECQTMGAPVLPPDINLSGIDFTSTKEGIRYGIAHIKGVGVSAAEDLLSRRPYGSLDQFFRNTPGKVLNARVLEALVKAGALDSLWSSREGLVQQAQGVAQLALEGRKHRSEGQSSLLRVRYRPQYTQEGPPPKDSNLRAGWERDTLGLAFTTPKVVLTLNRALSRQEWEWVAGLLGGHQPLEIRYGSIIIGTNAAATYSEDLKRALSMIHVGVEEK